MELKKQKISLIGNLLLFYGRWLIKERVLQFLKNYSETATALIILFAGLKKISAGAVVLLAVSKIANMAFFCEFVFGMTKVELVKAPPTSVAVISKLLVDWRVFTTLTTALC